MYKLFGALVGLAVYTAVMSLYTAGKLTVLLLRALVLPWLPCPVRLEVTEVRARARVKITAKQLRDTFG